jgi:hypothetical protein
MLYHGGVIGTGSYASRFVRPQLHGVRRLLISELVFALYDRSRTIAVFLLFLLIFRIAGAVYNPTRILRLEAMISFNSDCIPVFAFTFSKAQVLSNPVMVFMFVRICIEVLLLFR